MKRKLFLLFLLPVLFLSFYSPNLISQNTVNAQAIDAPSNLTASAYCSSTGDSSLRFSWDWPSNASDFRWTLWYTGLDTGFLTLGKGPVSRTPPIIRNVQDDPIGTEYRWWVDVCDGGFFQTDNCKRADSHPSQQPTRATCAKDDPPPPQDDPSLEPGICSVKVSTPDGQDDENPELISLVITPNGNIADKKDPNYLDKYWVEVKGTSASSWVTSEKVPKFQFNNWPKTSETWYDGKQNLISKSGVITIPSLNFRNTLTDKASSAWDNKEYVVVVQRQDNIQSNKDEVCRGSFRIGKDSAEKTKLKLLSRPCGDGVWDKEKGCTKIKTAIGTISTDTNAFVRNILGLVLSISGGILILLLIFNGYKLMTSQGDPEKVKDARDGIISGIAGLLLIIFSIVLLRLITVNVLGLPGFL